MGRLNPDSWIDEYSNIDNHPLLWRKINMFCPWHMCHLKDLSFPAIVLLRRPVSKQIKAEPNASGQVCHKMASWVVPKVGKNPN